MVKWGEGEGCIYINYMRAPSDNISGSLWGDDPINMGCLLTSYPLEIIVAVMKAGLQSTLSPQPAQYFTTTSYLSTGLPLPQPLLALVT